MDRGTAQAERKGLARQLRAGWRSVVATGLVFVAGAFLALQLVEPRYEARAVISTQGEAAAPGAAPASSLVILVASPAFASAVAARLGDDPWSRPTPSLPDRIVEILEGAPVRDAVREPTRGIVESVSVERGSAPGEIAVTALAGTPRDAGNLADAVAAELVAWIGSSADAAPPETPSPRDDAAIEREQASVDELRGRLAALPPGRADPAAPGDRRADVERSRDELRDDVAEAEERLRSVEALAEDPSVQISPEALGDGPLARAVARHRQLAGSVDNLSRTLLEGHPRLRIAQLRLTDLATEIETAAVEAAEAAATERDALQLRLTGLEAEIARLDETAASERASAQEREVLGAELAAAEERLAAAESAAPPVEAPRPPAASIVSSGEADAREAPAPVLLVTVLAGLSGLVAGAAGVALSGLVARPPAQVSMTAAFPASPPSAPAVARPAVVPPVGVASPEAAQPPARRETIALADVAAALRTSPVSRALIVTVADGDGEPMSLSLARALARQDSLVLLVDLSPEQRASMRAGVPRGGIGFHEIAAGQVGLSGASVGDEESAADIVAGGRRLDQVSGRAGAEALYFARKAYDHVLVDCGRRPASEIIGLADEECAILMPADGVGDEALSDRLRELAAAGLDTVILIG